MLWDQFTALLPWFWNSLAVAPNLSILQIKEMETWASYMCPGQWSWQGVLGMGNALESGRWPNLLRPLLAVALARVPHVAAVRPVSAFPTLYYLLVIDKLLAKLKHNRM